MNKTQEFTLAAPFAGFYGDGCHYGLGELYDEHKEALKKAISSGMPFDTGWFGSKKEILSGRVSYVEVEYVCQASVSDDFDTEGLGKVAVLRDPVEEVDATYERIMEALCRATDLADENKKENEEYVGFSTHPIFADETTGPWIETLIMPKGDFAGENDSPPGDCYHRWFFQGEARLPKPLREEIIGWAYGNLNAPNCCEFDCGTYLWMMEWDAQTRKHIKTRHFHRVLVKAWEG